jgi:hypothetical protein
MRLATLALGCALALSPAIQAAPSGAATPVSYYYHGHPYRYHHNGGYYDYRSNGQYYRYHSNGGFYNYHQHGHYYNRRYRCGVSWCFG